jgi:dATP pyrophosphohydrolase
VAAGAGKVSHKRPESVLVVVTAATGEVLLLCRREPPDFWQSVTGSLEWGETPAGAARRELYEETGIEAGDALVDLAHTVRFPILPAWRARYAPGTETNLEHWFHLALPAPVDVRLNPAEHTGYRWLPALEALRRASSHTDREAIDTLSIPR